MTVNYIAIDSMVIYFVDLPIDSMVIFHSYVNVYQRVPSQLLKPWHIEIVDLANYCKRLPEGISWRYCGWASEIQIPS